MINSFHSTYISDLSVLKLILTNHVSLFKSKNSVFLQKPSNTITLLFEKSLIICLTVAEISNSVSKSKYLTQHSYDII